MWVGERKVAALGVRISRGVASHGLALNVATDLPRYRHIVPCGTPDKEVASIHSLLGQQQGQLQQHRRWEQQAAEAAQVRAGASSAPPPPSLQQVAADLLDAFAAHFGYNRFEPLPDAARLAAELGCANK